MIRVLQFGRSGQLGRALLRLGIAKGCSIHALGREDIDLVNTEDVTRAVENAEPFDVAIMAAAYTKVDQAEAEPALAEAVNHAALEAVGRAAAARGAGVVHVSTDYVFDGLGGAPYAEDAQTNPQNIYGATKLRGETALLGANPRSIILRTSWVYAPGGANFVSTMQRLGRERTELRVVADQIGCPTHADDLAEAVLAAAHAVATDTGPRGVFHFSGAGETSWAQFAEAIFALDASIVPKPRVIAIPTTEYPTPARRPLDTRMNCARFDAEFGLLRPHWRERLAHALNEMNCATHSAEKG